MGNGERAMTAGPFSAALTTGFVLSLVLWAGDLVHEPAPALSYGMAALFFQLLVWLPVSLGAGLASLVILGHRDPYHWLGMVLARLLRWSTTVNRQAGFMVVVVSGALAVYLASALTMSLWISRELAQAIATPRFQAILSVGATLTVFIVFIGAYLFLHMLGKRLRSLVGTAPYVSALWALPLVPLLADVLAACGLAVIAFLSYGEAISLAPWQLPAWFFGAALISALLAWGLTRAYARSWVTAIVAGLVIGTVASGAIAAGRLSTLDRDARLYFNRCATAGVFYKVLNRALDRDGDGHMHQFAGGDCAPDERRISPTAIDVPGNDIDEDCNGKDVRFASLKRGRWDYPIPEEFPEPPLPVIIITSDALSANHMPFFGYHRKITPNLSKLAERCVVFEKAFSQGPSTRLSLGTIFTGLFDTQVSRGPGTKVPYPFAEENLTMAEAFSASGYDTVAVVPYGYFYSRWKGILQGFDKVDKSAAVRRKKKKNQAIHNAPKVTKAAIKQIKKRRSRPLFMWVHYYDNHYPFKQPKGVPKYGKKRIDRYDAEVQYFDKHVRALLQQIEKKYGKDGYILIIASDHGTSFDAHHPKMSQGYDLYTSVLHIPMLWCNSHMPYRRVRRTPVSMMDVFPTLVNLLGLEAETVFEGTSLVPLLFDDIEWEDRKVFHQFFLIEKLKKNEDPLFAASVRTADYNFIWNRKKHEYHLYRYGEDPYEESNLYELEQETADDLDSALKTWLFRVHRKYRLGSADGDDLEDDGGKGYDDSIVY